MEPKKTQNQKLIESIGLVGSSKKFAEVARLVIAYRATSFNTLILGETGTGKMAVARAFHIPDRGDENHLFSLDCKEFAVENSLKFASFLFGVKKGSFPGATRDSPGFLDKMTQGTFILEDIHELSIESQGLIQQFIETKTYSTYRDFETTTKCPARLVITAASDLLERIHDGRFSDSLYARLRELELFIPPLRERPEDIEALVNYLIDSCPLPKKPRFSKEALACLKRQEWKHNLMELNAFIVRAMVDFQDQDLITLNDVRKRSKSFIFSKFRP